MQVRIPQIITIGMERKNEGPGRLEVCRFPQIENTFRPGMCLYQQK